MWEVGEIRDYTSWVLMLMWKEKYFIQSRVKHDQHITLTFSTYYSLFCLYGPGSSHKIVHPTSWRLFYFHVKVTSIYHFFLFSDKTTYHIGQESHFPNGENNFLTQRINFQNYKRSQGLLQVKSNYRKSFKISK